MLKDKINKLIDDKIYKNKEVIKSLLLPSIGFIIESKEIGFSSSIGGQAPIDDNQFTFLKEKPLILIARIELSQISEMNNVLPKNGLLYFFICTDILDYRFPDKKEEFKVLYIDNASEISSKSFVKKNALKEYPISFFEYCTLPSYQEGIIKKNNISDDELNIINEIQEEIMLSVNEDFEIPHQLLGHPNALQGTVKFWWAAKYLEIDTAIEISEEDMKRINEIEEDFVLLLQLNFNDSKIEIDNFGDSIAYFGILRNDLINKDFSKVVLEMQNT
jgi:uncharacterized protein YwqG